MAGCGLRGLRAAAPTRSHRRPSAYVAGVEAVAPVPICCAAVQSWLPIRRHDLLTDLRGRVDRAINSLGPTIPFDRRLPAVVLVCLSNGNRKGFDEKKSTESSDSQRECDLGRGIPSGESNHVGHA